MSGKIQYPSYPPYNYSNKRIAVMPIYRLGQATEQIIHLLNCDIKEWYLNTTTPLSKGRN